MMRACTSRAHLSRSGTERNHADFARSGRKLMTFCSSLRSQVTEEEWAVREELAAFYRVVHRYGMSQLTNNHITLKVPGAEDHFLLNPWGLSYDEITASSLMKIDLAGNIVLQPSHGLGINYTGFVIHGAIHGARPDIHCIVHTHTRAGIAVATMECGLLMLHNSAYYLADNVAYHDWEGPSLKVEEQQRLVDSLGDRDTMILRHHGLLACGRNVAEAFLNLHSLEFSCQIQIDVLGSGQSLRPPPPEAADEMREVMRGYRKSGQIGLVEWAAERRWLDRHDPSYRY
jgi:ribulose-5-phosphate 4-epimerase/fuculose-1-phosphate aldolase